MKKLKLAPNIQFLSETSSNFLKECDELTITDLYELGLVNPEDFLRIGNAIVPFITLNETGSVFKEEDIYCDLLPTSYRASFEEFDYVLNKIFEEQKGRGNLFDGRGFKLRKTTLRKKSREYLYLTLQPTNFYSVLGTNFILNKKVLNRSAKENISLREKYDIDVKNLSETLLGNMLATHILLISEIQDKKFVILTKRNSESFSIYKGCLQVSASGYLCEEDINCNGKMDVFNTAIREVWEELGFEISPSLIRFLGVGVDMITGEPELFGIANIRKSKQNLLDLFKKAQDFHESEKLVLVNFDPTVLGQYLLNNKWVPASAACCIYALVHEFGLEETRLALTVD